MEFYERKEKQEISISMTMNVFLMAGKVDMKPNLEGEITCIQRGNQENHNVQPYNTPRPIAKIEKLKEQSFVDSRKPSSQYGYTPLQRLDQ